MKQGWNPGPEFGLRLRRLRNEAGLTQDEIAGRMGAKGRERRKLVERLELGRTRNPLLRTIVLYLRACGARWSGITDLLERTEEIPSGTAAIEESGLASGKVRCLKDRTGRQVQRYLRRLAYSAGAGKLAPDRQLAAAERLRNYRVAANLVEQEIGDRLERSGLARIDWTKYRAVGRGVLGVLWRSERGARTGRKREEWVRTRLAERRLSWTGFRLEPGLAEEVERIVIERFGRLQAEHPELFD